MEMSAIVEQYLDAYTVKYGDKTLPDHWKTIHAILRCRTPDSGELYVSCPDCNHAQWKPLSCGNRHCPKCQNHEVSNWIDKQQAKLLPVPYFMVTFTIPYELRNLCRINQKKMYSIFFATVSATLKDFGVNSKQLAGEVGMTMVLHTHSRRLEYHPHIHVVIPGGAINRKTGFWKKVKGNFLFHHKALAKVFRARFLAAVGNADVLLPENIPNKWVVDCTAVGQGLSALKYLAKYLYRGVISESNIVANNNGLVTFRYVDSDTGKDAYRTLPGEDFLKLILQHVLPTGFRRVRDFGFLHGNAKKLLKLIQLILRVILVDIKRSRPVFKCPCCKKTMVVLAYRNRKNCPG